MILRSSPTPPSASDQSSADSHKNEGFLKSAWHRLTNQHKDVPENNDSNKKSQSDAKQDEPEKKNASGSG
jgi:molecular chaperone DnaJ